MGGYVRALLPSGRHEGPCLPTAGPQSASSEATAEPRSPFSRQGAAHHRARARGKQSPTVSGVAMNPVDHPHGGGNHQAVHGPNSVARNAPPGQKVGNIAPRRTGRGRSKKE
jgi:Ribosomal protein L2